jgi:hypothetical protein
MSAPAAAETWAVGAVQLDPAPRDPGVMLHCVVDVARPLCSGDMALFWYEKRQRITITAAIANGRLYVKVLLHPKDSGDRYLFAGTQRYLEIPLSRPTRRGGVWAQEAALSEPPPHADADWPDWLTNPRVIPYLNIAATLQLTFWREE